MDISALRREYIKDHLEPELLMQDPVDQFAQWFEEAKNTGMPDPRGRALATDG